MHLNNLMQLARNKGLLRSRDLDEHGIPRRYLAVARDSGLLERIDRALYSIPGALQTEHRSLVEVSSLCRTESFACSQRFSSMA